MEKDIEHLTAFKALFGKRWPEVFEFAQSIEFRLEACSDNAKFRRRFTDLFFEQLFAAIEKQEKWDVLCEYVRKKGWME